MVNARDAEVGADVTPAAALGIAVEVLVEGTWLPGDLEHWRQRDGRREGYVWWTAGIGLRHVGWVDEDQLRPGATTSPH